MSKNDVTAFLDRLTAEEEFRHEVGRALQGEGDAGAATVAVAREEGFEFTAEEFDEALEERYSSRELGDDELEAASGGTPSFVGFFGVVYTTSSGAAIAFPDVCKTPAPGGPIAIPYPTTGTVSGDSTGTKSTKSSG